MVSMSPWRRVENSRFCIGKLHEGECYWREMGVVRKQLQMSTKGLSNEGLGIGQSYLGWSGGGVRGAVKVT